MLTFVKQGCGAVLLMLGVAAVGQAAEPVTFTYQFSQDDKLIYRTESKIDQTQTITFMGNETKLKNEIVNKDVSVYTLQEKTEDGNFKLQKENKQLYISMTMDPLGKYLFDSESTEREEGSVLATNLNPLYSAMHKAYLFPVVTPQGKVTKLEGYSELIKDALKDNPIAAQFAGGGSDEVAALQVAQVFPEFPDKKDVAENEAWEIPFEVALPNIGTLNGKRRYRYEGMEKVGEQNLAKLSFTDELAGKIDVKIMGSEVTGNLTITEGTGTAWFDVEKGHLVKLESKTAMNGDLNVSVGGQNIPVTQQTVTTSKVELLDKLPE